MPEDAQPVHTEVAFLGIAERSSVIRDGMLEAVKWNILGLKPILTFNFFPANLSGVHLVFAFRHLQETQLRFSIRLENGDEIGGIEIGSTAVPTPLPLPATATRQHSLTYLPPDGWSLMVFVLPQAPPVTMMGPGRYLVTRLTPDGAGETVGEFLVGLVEPQPLTAEHIAAIKSDPRALKAVRVVLSCKKCHAECRAYAGLDRSENLEKEGFVWYADLSEQFQCACGATLVDLASMRRNLYAPLGNFSPAAEPADYIPLYEAASLDNTRTEFMRLLDSHQREEVFQKFIEDNPILLRQFPAEQILFKPPILTFYNADFAVLSPQRELILVEIETPETRLLKKDGDQAAPLTHAIDQVQRWLGVLDEHRVAALASMKIDAQMVGNIRGVVIAGRDRGNDKDHLRRLKGMLSGRITFLTFDDLAASLAALIEQMRRL